MKQRLDQTLAARKLVNSRSQAESYIRLGHVMVNGRTITKTGEMVDDQDVIKLTAEEQYVSRAALKLASVAQALKINFAGKTILDVGSSTGGFTDYALRQGAAKSIAVDVGTDQLHPLLQGDPRIELHEQTDIRDFITDQKIDIVVADVSFISLREILPHVVKLCSPQTQIVAMVKPQFEVRAEHGKAGRGSTGQANSAGNDLKHKGIIKNDKMRREILKHFEQWALQYFRIIDKADSSVSGSKGNIERFYLLQKIK